MNITITDSERVDALAKYFGFNLVSKQCGIWALNANYAKLEQDMRYGVGFSPKYDIDKPTIRDLLDHLVNKEREGKNNVV